MMIWGRSVLPPAGALTGFTNSTHPKGLPIFPPPPGQTQWRGGYSTQLTLKDSKFIECNQVLVNWGDWTACESQFGPLYLVFV